MSTQTWLREVRDLLADMGVTYRMVHGTRHAKFYVSKDGRSGLVTVALSPSDRMAIYSVAKQVRHALGLVRATQKA